MIYRFVRDPITSFFEEMEEGFDFDPFRVTPLRVLALEEGPRFRRNRQQQQNQETLAERKRKALKRKSCCHCNCHGEEEEKRVEEENKDKQVDIHHKGGEELVPAKKSKFEVKLNVDPRYKPGELKVKLSADNRSIIVEGKHQESHKGENGFSSVSSQMYQRFSLPNDVNIEEMKCDLDENGVMVISAPRKLLAIEGKKKQEVEEPKKISIAIENRKDEGKEKESGNEVEEENPEK